MRLRIIYHNISVGSYTNHISCTIAYNGFYIHYLEVALRNVNRPEGKQVPRMNQESLQDPAWGRAPLVITISITILCF
jgi:hypothetical protein